MDYFLASDVARLILRYLKENSYMKTYHCFMRECSFLKEFYNLVKAGRQPIQISHLNLITILEEWGKIKSQTDQSEQNEQNYITHSPTSSLSYDTTDETLVSDNDVTHKNNSKKSPKGNKKLKVVSKKVKSSSGKSPKSQSSPPSVTIFSPKKLRSGKNRESQRNDETDGSKVNSPAQSSIKSPGRSLEASLKSPLAKVTVHPVVKIVTSENCIIESPTKCDRVNTTGETVKSKDDTIVNGDKIQSVVDNLNNNNKPSNDRINPSGVTSVKPSTEPPSESLGITDKCLSWMNRNEREDESNQGSETNTKSSDCDGGNIDNVKDQQQGLRHEPVIPCLVTPKKMPPSASVSGDNLITPVKLLQTSHEHISRSPRRKKPKTPKKRNSEVSPVSMISGLSVDPMFEKILSDHRLHMKLAETCNSIVHCHNKSGNSTNTKKEASGTQAHQVSPGVSTTYDQETAAASKSLEEILAVDNNVHTELLSDNIDMSDPAYESLFKLFGTDRETFSEYLRKEKDKEEALEAEVEELERSNHEIMCASLGIPSADSSYDRVDINSPQSAGVHHELFASQHSIPSQRNNMVTSTPCLESVPVNFTPLLRSHELGSSPVNSTPDIFSDKKLSPCSTATQPFSPSYSHCSEQNPSTPRHPRYPATGLSTTKSPRHVTEDVYSNPATPQSYSASTNNLVHSTPTGPGSVRSQSSYDNFHKSSPIQVHSPCVPAVHSGRLPITCSPLVKADLNAASPRMIQKNTDQTVGASIITLPSSATANSGLYFNSQQKLISTSTPINTVHSQQPQPPGPFISLLDDDSMPGEPCSTIDNSIGCISIPSRPRIEEADKLNMKSSQCNPTIKEKLKNSLGGKDYSALKGLLAQPLKHRMTVQLGYTAEELSEALNKSADQSLTFHSPNGKSTFQVPILDYQDKPVAEDLLGSENDEDQTINVYNEALDSSAQYSLAPENQSTKDLVNAIKAGCSAEVLQKIQSQPRVSNTEKSKSKKNKNTGKKKDKSEKENSSKNDINDEASMPGVTPLINSELDGNQEIFTATPLNALKRATTVRALNFGNNENFRKILPKVTPISTVVIINEDQYITPTSEDNVITAEESVQKNSPMKNSPMKKDKKGPALKSPLKKSLAKRDKPENSNTPDENVKNLDKSDNDKSDNVNTKTIKPSDEVNISDEDFSDRRVTRNRKKARKSKEIMTVKLPVNNSASNKSKKRKTDEEPKGSILSFFKPKTKENSSGNELKSEVNNSDHKPNTTVDSPNKGGKCTQSKKKSETKDKKASVTSGNKSTGSMALGNKSTGRTSAKGKRKEPYKSVEIISDEDSSSDEQKRVPLTPMKDTSKEASVDLTEADAETSKVLLLEKIGLTPKKQLNESEVMYESPSRANALDVLAEWQKSPSSRTRTPVTRSRFARIEDQTSPFKSPVKTPRKTPAKKLFTSPCKKQTANIPKKNTKATAERVNSMIAQIKRDHPNSRLPSPLKPDEEDSETIDHEYFINENKLVKGEKIEKENKKGSNSNMNSVNDKKVKKKSKHSRKVKDLASDSDTVDYKIDIEPVRHNLTDVSDLNKKNSNKMAAKSDDVVNEHYDDVTVVGNNVVNEHKHSDSPVVDNDESNTCHNIDNDENIDEIAELESGTDAVKENSDKLDMSDEVNVKTRTLSESYSNNVNNTDVTRNKKNNSLNENTHLVHVDVHAPPASNIESDDNMDEETATLNDEIENINQNSNNSDRDYNEIEIHAPNDGVVDTIDKSHERRRKHKHRHRHKHRHTSGENGQVGDLFVSPNDSKEHKHHRHRHHHHKKKKSHKRKREREDDEGHNRKRHKRDRSKVDSPVDSLSALNVDEALSQIYNKQT